MENTNKNNNNNHSINGLIIGIGGFFIVIVIAIGIIKRNSITLEHNDPNVYTQETGSCIPSAGSNCELKQNKDVVGNTKINPNVMKEYAKEMKDDVKKIKKEIEEKRVTLKKDNLLILWNEHYKTENFFYKDVNKIKKYDKVGYLRVPLSKELLTKGEVNKIESKLYNCKFNKAEEAVICNRKDILKEQNIQNNMIGKNLYLFSIKFKNEENNKQIEKK